jgi:hypothetical protein
MVICKNCGHQGTGKYCSECGQPYEVKRITVGTIIHEVTHLFTHLDKGFLYTLKQLAIHPGWMQRNYLDGERSKHQKPFSVFFICATLAGLGIYLMTKPSSSESSPFDEMRIHFYRHYYVIMQTAMTPFYALVVWLFFGSKKLNYAETLVLFAYSSSFVLLLVILTNAINLIPGHIETWYVEIPVLAGYITWTNLNFFNTQPKWLVIIKSVFSILICWFASYFITDLVIRWMM